MAEEKPTADGDPERSETDVTALMDHWWASPFVEFINYNNHQKALFQLTEEALTQWRDMNRLREAMAKASRTLNRGDEASKFEKAAERIKAQVKLAEIEYDNKFAHLRGAYIVLFWSGLEALVDDVVLAGIEHGHLKTDVVKLEKIRVRLVDIMSLAPAELARKAFDIIRADVLSQGGMGRFDDLLAAVGLDFAVSKETRDALWDMSAIRNLLAHRRGIVDQQFMDRCPGSGQTLGEALTIEAQTIDRFNHEVYQFVAGLMERLLVAWELDPDEDADLHASKSTDEAEPQVLED